MNTWNVDPIMGDPVMGDPHKELIEGETPCVWGTTSHRGVAQSTLLADAVSASEHMNRSPIVIPRPRGHSWFRRFADSQLGVMLSITMILICGAVAIVIIGRWVA